MFESRAPAVDPESRVLGVDPGVARVGIAVVEVRDRRPTLLWADTLRTPAGLSESARLRMIHEAIGAAVIEHHPRSVAVERVAWNTNQVSALAVARATGVILLAASEAGLGVEEYGPLEVKMAVTGIGNANKAQVRAALTRLHGLEGVPRQPDAADAVSVALCHLQQSRLRRVSRVAR
jgi:crossover junction endodeoxyribonuclease RuvC